MQTWQGTHGRLAGSLGSPQVPGKHMPSAPWSPDRVGGAAGTGKTKQTCASAAFKTEAPLVLS